MRCEAIYCFDLGTVRFAFYPGGFDGPRVLAEITEEALRDLFGAREGGDSLVSACQAYFEAIESVALAHHHAAPTQAVRLGTEDFALPSARGVDEGLAC